MIIELIIGYFALKSITEGIGEIVVEHEQRDIEMQNKLDKIQERLEYYKNH